MTVAFGPFRLDLNEKVLSFEGASLPVPLKEMEVLVLLVQKHGKIVSKSDILDSIWPNVYVEEATVARHVSSLRQRLQAHSDENFIETIPKRGYRFNGVREESEAVPAAPAGQLMLAVLPFANLSGDAAQEYFSDGFTEEMITCLSRWNPERLRVIARTSSMLYRNTEKSVAQIAAELNATHILEGSIRRDGDTVRITAQLIEARSQAHLWANTYDRTLKNLIALQSEVTTEIAKEIQVTLDPVVRNSGRTAVDPAAYDAYLRGRHFWNLRTEEGLRNAVTRFEEALQHQPDLALAYAGIADAHVMLACRGICAVTDSFRHARVAAQKAMELDPALGEAHAALAHLQLHQCEWAGLDALFRRALELNPSHAVAYYWYAEYLMARGRADEAIAMTRRAATIDPLSPVIAAAHGVMLYLAGRLDEARDVLQQALDLNPGFFLLHLRLGLVLVQLRQFAEAVAAMRQATILAPSSLESLAGLGISYAASGDAEKAAQIITQLQENPQARYVLPLNVAKIYAAGGDHEGAFAFLETAYREANCDLIELGADPIFRPLRGDERFTSLLRRLDLPTPQAERAAG